MALMLNDGQTKMYTNQQRLKRLRLSLMGLIVAVIIGCASAEKAQSVQTESVESAAKLKQLSDIDATASPVDVDTLVEKSVSIPNDVNGLGRLEVEKLVYDYGKIKPMLSHEAQFHFKNVGVGPLLIKEFKGCCGAIAKLDREKPWIYEPNEKGYLSVRYRPSFDAPSGKSDATEAPFKKYLYLITDDPNDPIARLTVQGTVMKTMTIEPMKVKLFSNRVNCGARNMTIRALDGEPFSIKDYQCTGDCITVAYEPNTPAVEHLLIPTVDKDKLMAMKPSRGRIQFNLDRPDYKNVLFYFDLLPNYVVTPLQIFIFGADPAKKEVRSIDILDNYAKDANEITFDIESIKTGSGAVKILSKDPIQDGYRLKVEINPPKAKAGQTNFTDPITITLKTGEEFIIPARGFYSQSVMLKARKEANQ